MKTLLLNRWFFFLSLFVLSGPFGRAQVAGPGSALNLDGASGYAQAPSGVWFSNNFTVEGWVNVRSYNNWSRLFDFGNGAGYLQEVYLALSEGAGGFPKMGVFTNGNNNLVGSSQQLPLNQWAHLAVTLSGSTATILMNGNPVGSGTVLVPNSVVRTNNYIGRSLFGGDAYANALFDEVRIWNVARTTNQIQAFMHRNLAGNETGLLGYWRMDEGAGTTLTDSSGHGQTATLFGGTSWSNSTAPLTVGPGTALNFNSTNCQTVQIAHQAALNAYPLTVMTWFMVPTNSNGGALVNKYVSSSKNGYQIFLAGNLRAWYFRDQNNNVFNNGVMDAGPVNDGLWHHAAMAVDAAGGRLYLDGVLKSSVAWSGTPGAPTTTQPLAFGIYPGDSCFTGQMDEVSIWNTALSIAQIQSFMHRSLQGTESGLLAYYRLDEGSGTNTVDGTGNGFNGTLAGPPTWIASGAMVGAPQVTTLAATGVAGASATLNGTANAEGQPTTAWFRWGTNTTYGSNTTAASIPAAFSNSAYNVTLSGLTAGTYHYQAIATNTGGTNVGADMTFTIVSSPPLVTNLTVTSITPNGATLNATVNPDGAATAVYFAYGTTTDYGTTNAAVNIGSGNSPVPVASLLTNLAPGTLYHFTTIASNLAGTTSGVDATFTTLSTFSPVAAGLQSGYAQTLAWGDFNNDGWLDLLQMPYVMSNRLNGTFGSVFDGVPAAYYGAQVWADFDNDGYLDLLVTGTQNGGTPVQTVLLRNNHNGTLTANGNTGLPNCEKSSIAVGDFDNDGLPDVLLMGYGGGGNIGFGGIWHNNGNGTFTQIPIPGLPVGWNGSVACGDFDNDGYLDFVIAGVYFGNTGNYFAQVWRNNGDGTFTQISVPGLQPMYSAFVAVADYNDDGYLDFVISGQTKFGDIITQIWKNNGGWNFTLEGNAVLPGTLQGPVAWADFDNNGYPDLAIAGPTAISSGSASSPIAQLWRNTGNGTFTDINANFPAWVYNSIAFGDFNNDGRLDFVQMGYGGGGHVDLEQNNTPVTNTPPTAPPGLQAVVHGSGVVLTWNAASDAQTPASGLSYNFRVGTAPGAINVVAPMADTSTGRRRLPQLGNAGEALKAVLTNLTAGTYYWSVQAIDTAFAGSPFAMEGQFTITLPILFTGPAGQISSNSATLNGSFLPNGSDATAWFQWGANSSALTNITPSAFARGTNTTPVAASQTVSGLLPGTQYYYRMAATNASGSSLGAVSNFTTLPSFLLAVTRLAEPPAVGTDSVFLAVSPGYVGWSASANDAWLHVLTPSGAGSAVVAFSYDGNSGATRTGTLTIAGQTFTVIQAGSTYVGFTAQPDNFAPSTLMTLTTGLTSPVALGVDGAGNLYFTDFFDDAVKEWIKSNNTVVTLVSNGLNAPTGLALDKAGNVYIADTFNDAIKKWSAADHSVTTLVGSGLSAPSALACDNWGNIYIADTGNNAIKVWIAATSNVFTLFSTGLNQPAGVAVDQFGNVYIADTMNNALYEMLFTSGAVITLATNVTQPSNLAVDASGNVYIADPWDWLILRWSPATGIISDVIDRDIYNCSGVAVDGAGNIYVTDSGHHALEEMPRAFLDPTAKTEPYTAGSDALPPVVPADADLSGPLAPYSDQPWLTITGITNGVTSFAFAANTTGAPRRGRIFVFSEPVIIDQGAVILGTTNLVEGPAAGTDSVVLAVSPPVVPWSASANAGWLHLAPGYQSGSAGTNIIFTFDANSGATRTGTLTLGGVTVYVTQAGASYVAAPIQLTALVSTGLVAPLSLALDSAGNVYFSDGGDQTIKLWTRANNSAATFISSGLGHPTGVAFDPYGDVFIVDTASNALYYCMPPHTNVYALVSSGLNSPWGVAVDSSVNVYIADTGNNAIKRWNPDDGSVSVLVSTGLNGPKGVAVDVGGNVYFADSGNNAIKEWLAASSNVVTLASGLNAPTGVAVDGSGNVYFADSGNNAIKKWSAINGAVTTLISTGLSNPSGICVDSADDVYIVDSGNKAIEELPRAFVDPTTRFEPFVGGGDALPAILPASVNLLPPFAPTTDQPWVSVTNTSGGVVGFAFTANSGPVRTGHINVLGESVSIIQTNSLVTPPILTGAQRLSNGSFQFAFTNTPGATFHVLTATNVDLPSANWVNLGTVSNVSPGLFQFTTVISSNSPQQFFRVVWP